MASVKREHVWVVRVAEKLSGKCDLMRNPYSKLTEKDDGLVTTYRSWLLATEHARYGLDVA